MTKEYIPGQDCGCYAYSESECGCGAEWTPSEVYELRWKLERERALADRLGKMLELYYVNDDIAHHAGIANAIAAWKEARSE